MDDIKKLILLRNQLKLEIDNFDHVQSFYSSNSKIGKIKTLYPSEFNSDLDAVANKFTDMVKINVNVVDYLEETIERIEKEINRLIQDRSNMVIFNRDQLFVEDLSTYKPVDLGDSLEEVRQQLALKSLLKYPVLCLAPRDRRVINWLVGGDPLYLCMPRLFDTVTSMTFPLEGNAQLFSMSTKNPKQYLFKDNVHHGDWFSCWQIQQVIDHLPRQYQQRVRLYSENNKDFDHLPQEQFGHIVIWDYFNYLTTDEIEEYLQALLLLLRPGGEISFSYNNCETTQSLQYSISQDQTYNSETLMKNLCLKLQYDFVSSRNIQTGIKSIVSLMTIKRPGTLSSVKVSQSLASIVHKSKKTVEVIKDYSAEEIEQLQNRAAELGVEHDIYDPKILEQKIKEKEKSLSNDVAKPK